MIKTLYRNKFKWLLALPATGLALAGVIMWQSYSQGGDSFMARAQEVYSQDLANSQDTIWHTISLITEASGQKETIETWVDDSREAITVYDANQKVIEKTVNINTNTDDVQTYTLDDQGNLDNLPTDQAVICINDDMANGVVDANQSGLAKLVDTSSNLPSTTINRTEVLGKILQGTGVTDLGVVDGLHGFNVKDITGNVDYYLDDNTLSFRKLAVHNLTTGVITAVRENTISESLEANQTNVQVFDHTGLFSSPYTQFMEKYGATLDGNKTGCYRGDGTKINDEDILQNGIYNWGDAAAATETTESVVCPSADCINEQ